eukprot:366317-Chlamydomonas_euryale.AAC.2
MAERIFSHHLTIRETERTGRENAVASPPTRPPAAERVRVRESESERERERIRETGRDRKRHEKHICRGRLPPPAVCSDRGDEAKKAARGARGASLASAARAGGARRREAGWKRDSGRCVPS